MTKYGNRQSGIAALMLVMWTSLALAGLLFSLVSAYGSMLSAQKTENSKKAARSSALLCRDLLLVELSENVRFVPVVGSSSSFIYKSTTCHVTFFNSSLNFGAADGEIKTVNIEGRHILSDRIFGIETKIAVSAEPGAVPMALYTKEIYEGIIAR